MYYRLLARLKQFWLLAFIALCGIFVAKYLYSEVGRLRQPLHIRMEYLALAVGIQVLFWWLAAAIWKRVVRLTSGTHLAMLASLSHLFIVSLGKYLPGKVWGMLARGVRMKQHGVDAKGAFYATFHEQLLTLEASVVLCGALAFVLFDGLWAWLALTTVAGLLVCGKRTQQVAEFFFGKLLVWLGASDTYSKGTVLTEGVRISLILQFTVLWILNGLVVVCLYLAWFGGTLGYEFVVTVVFANTIGITLGFFALFAPAGIGVREGVTSALLVSQMPLADALMLSLLFRIWGVIIEVVGGTISLWLTRSTSVSQ